MERSSLKKRQRQTDDSLDTSIENNSPKRQKKDPRIFDGQYFEVTARDDKNTHISAICKLCGVVKKGSISSTGNFLKHIKDYHEEKSDEVYTYIKQISTKISMENCVLQFHKRR